MKASALALAVLLVASGCSAKADAPAQPARNYTAALPERPAGPVLDSANIFPDPVEAGLDAKLRQYWNRHRTAMVVASVTSLNGETIEHFANDLARKWGIGDRQTLRGVLVLVAPSERQVRIEVSCGLENVVTDVFAGQVIRDAMVPAFKTGRMADGTLAGVDALIQRIDSMPNPAPVSDSCQREMRQAA